YLPKIQTAEEAVLWNDLLAALEQHLGLPIGTIKAYVLVEHIEASFQLMETRAVLGRHFVGFNTGRWDYINSVADAMVWDPGFVNPNIDVIGMTYGYMRNYEARVRRAVNTRDRNGRRALWQGGMEPNIPVGSAAGGPAGRAGGGGGGGAAGTQACAGRGQAGSASNSRGRAASGWRTGRWCTSCGRYGRRSAWTTSSNASSRHSPTRRRTPTGWCCSSRRRAPSGALGTC